MSEAARSTAYDELVQAFKEAVIYALRTGRLSPICADFDVALIYAIGGIARAARNGGRADGALREACWAFGQFAVHQVSFEGDSPARNDLAQRAIRDRPDRPDTAWGGERVS